MSAINYIQKVAKQHNIEVNKLLYLTAYAAKLSFTELYNADVNDIEYAIYKALKSLRYNIPIARLTRYRYFYDDWFYISPFTLDPRPETEELIRKAILFNPKSILDIGTGSGCILISLLRNINNSYGLGIDICEYTLDNARYNAKNILYTNSKYQFGSNIDANTQFDIIISNPPYVRFAICDSVSFDPPLSIYYDCTKCVYKDIFSTAKRHLSKGGHLLLELPSYLLTQVKYLAENHGFSIELFYESNTILFVCIAHC